MKEVNNIIELIKSDPKYNRFHEISLLINNDKKIKIKLSKIKNIQKELVNVIHLEKNNAIKALQREYESLMDELLEIPLLNEYLDLVNYYNDLILTIKDIIEGEINDYFIKNT